METAVATENSSGSSAGYECGPVVGLVSVLAVAAAGTLLGYSVFSKKRRIPVSVQVLLGLVVGGAGAVTWTKRREEIEAARQFLEHVHDVRDKRWLKKHPVAYG